MSASLFSWITRGMLVVLLATFAFIGQAGEPRPGFRLGIINERPERPDLALEQYGKLHAYLSERLRAQQIEVGKLIITQNLQEMRDRIARGEIDALIEGVMPTLVLERQTGLLDPELLAWRKGQRQYVTVFFTRNDSPIRELHHLRGRTIAFEAERSTSAYFVPRAALRAAGLQLTPTTDQEGTA